LCRNDPFLEQFLKYFSAKEQYFSLTTNQHKHQHKPNFNETIRAETTTVIRNAQDFLDNLEEI